MQNWALLVSIQKSNRLEVVTFVRKSISHLLKDCRANNTHVISSDSTSHHFIRCITGFNHTAQGYLDHSSSTYYYSAFLLHFSCTFVNTNFFITADTARCWGEVMWTSVKLPTVLRSTPSNATLKSSESISDHFKFFNKVEDALSHHCYFHYWLSWIKLALFTRKQKLKMSNKNH